MLFPTLDLPAASPLMLLKSHPVLQVVQAPHLQRLPPRWAPHPINSSPPTLGSPPRSICFRQTKPLASHHPHSRPKYSVGFQNHGGLCTSFYWKSLPGLPFPKACLSASSHRSPAHSLARGRHENVCPIEEIKWFAQSHRASYRCSAVWWGLYIQMIN